MHRTFVLLLGVSLVACSDGTAPSHSCLRGTVTGEGAINAALPVSACSLGADYAVALTQGERYLFTLESHGGWLPSLELLQPSRKDSVMVTGWSDDVGTDVRHSEILVVAPYSGEFKLRVRGLSGTAGAYVLRSHQCGGSSQEIFSSTAVSTLGTVSTSSCVIHDRLLDHDSTRADLYVLYLGRQESKLITVKTTSGTLTPAFILTGPFLDRNSVSLRSMAIASADSMSVRVTGGTEAGDYVLAVGGARYEQTGGYRVTIAPSQ